MTELFTISSKKAKRNYTTIFSKKQYNLKGLNSVKKYFVHLGVTTE